MKRLYILTICAVILAFVTHYLNDEPSTIESGAGLVLPKDWLYENKDSKTPKQDQRAPDQTFLTFPEWYLVFSPAEQAQYFKNHTATTFPYMENLAQLWKSYRIVNNQIKGNFKPNPGYHFMIWVISGSTTVEYGVKSWYEKVVGRVTDTKTPLTEEDQLNATYQQDYVNFINDLPWYQFDFKHQLGNLWMNTDVIGAQPFRKLERRYYLTTELMVKMFYGKLIGLGTKQIYDEAALTTTCILQNDSLVTLHRYNRFAPEALALAQKGYAFKEIAGNTDAITLSVIAPNRYYNSIPDTKWIFYQPIPTNMGEKRILLATKVQNLSKVLLTIQKAQLKIEHVFDY